jgi:2-methylcitrate dehydratase PrpD
LTPAQPGPRPTLPRQDESHGAGLTRSLAQQSAALRAHEIPDDVVEIARQCLLDWLAVTLGGSAEPAPRTLLEVLEAGGRETDHAAATVVGRGVRLSPLHAALVNGTASHVLDFDDVNMAFVGHVSATVLPAALALAEQQGASSEDLLTAFVAGYETACRLGVAIGSQPYLRGYHATALIGVFGAAAACARLLELDAEGTARALGIAASSAGGLKCNFGTMTKALGVGRASADGLLAALLASGDFSASACAIEAPQGLAAALAIELPAELTGAPAPPRWHLRDNLFKHHASCYFTHSAIEGLLELTAQGAIQPANVQRVSLHVSELELGTCAIADPRTALEVKFSLAHLAAMVLLGRGTGAIGDEVASDGEVVALRSRVELVDDGVAGDPTRVDVALRGGEVRTARRDVSVPLHDLREQRQRLRKKFLLLAPDILSKDGAQRLLQALDPLDPQIGVRHLMALARR